VQFLANTMREMGMKNQNGRTNRRNMAVNTMREMGVENQNGSGLDSDWPHFAISG
jgi:hypothetical protein